MTITFKNVQDHLRVEQTHEIKPGRKSAYSILNMLDIGQSATWRLSSPSDSQVVADEVDGTLPDKYDLALELDDVAIELLL